MLKRALSTFAFVAALSFASSAACVWLLAISTLAQAQDYPSRAVTIISDSAAGSTPDAVLRVIADRLGQVWGQQVLAVNHPGATGSIASRIAADAPADGYTLYMPVLSTFVSLPGAAPNLPIRLPRDFSPIGFAGENPMFIVVNPSLGITTAFRSHCTGESASRRSILRGHRDRQAHASDRRTAAKPGRHRPVDRSLYRRPGAGDWRRREWPRRLHDRRVFGDRGGGGIRLGQSHSGRFGKAPRRIP